MAPSFQHARVLAKVFGIARRPRLALHLLRGTAAGVEHIDALAGLGLKTLIDVGASRGQFSLVARYLFPDLKVVAFEPLATPALQYERALGGPGVALHRCALGDAAGTRTFYVTDRDDSSSLLVPGPGQRLAYGVSARRQVEVDVRRLDAVVSPEDVARPALLKVDVQGTEAAVVRGSGAVLRAIDYAYLEVSFVELYRGQSLAAEVVSLMAAEGFALRGVYNVSHTRAFGATQADFLFARR